VQRVQTYSGYRYWLSNQEVTTKREETAASKQTIDTSRFEGWYASLSFYPTNSKKFMDALTIAKDAPQFIEHKDASGRIYYQAAYSSKSEEYAAFYSLFSLAKDWKTAELTINGKKMDMKRITTILDCYATKLKNDENYCFGYDEGSQNPFGCHRIGLSPKQEPWWSYGNFDSKNIWHVDKKAIVGEIQTGTKICKFCPAFSDKKVQEVYESLPEEIDSDNNKNWYRSGYSIRPIPGKDPLSNEK
jgi:hypothetical protein